MLADWCVVVFLTLLVPLLLLFFIRLFGRVVGALIVFDQKHHFLHGVRCARDQSLHLLGVCFRQCCDEFFGRFRLLVDCICLELLCS